MATSEAAGEPPGGEALWHFSLAFYERPRVAEALTGLQDRAGLDVNLMLFALWAGASGGGELTAETLAVAARIARPIRSDLIEPLRALRRKLRLNPDPDIQQLRQGIKSLELAAEKLVQDRLGRIPLSAGADADPGARIGDAHANLALYFGSEIAGSAEAGVIRKALDEFVRNERVYRSPRRGLGREEGSPQRRTPPVSRSNRSRTRPSV
jgi:uncharacterized protein (TIGR02444 family)